MDSRVTTTVYAIYHKARVQGQTAPAARLVGRSFTAP